VSKGYNTRWKMACQRQSGGTEKKTTTLGGVDTQGTILFVRTNIQKKSNRDISDWFRGGTVWVCKVGRKGEKET